MLENSNDRDFSTDKLKRRLAMETEAGRQALEVMDRVNRSLSPEQRVFKSFELTEMSRQVMRAGISHANPGATEDEIQAIYIDRLLAYHGTSIAQIRAQQATENH